VTEAENKTPENAEPAMALALFAAKLAINFAVTEMADAIANALGVNILVPSREIGE
tara:strand:- start:330 stop:497 length:168 start_codon:yes stop_codon:yes gene_type:complete